MQEMGLLEVKHGLLQIAETLDFLHSNARLIHRSISPEVFILFSHFSNYLCHYLRVGYALLMHIINMKPSISQLNIYLKYKHRDGRGRDIQLPNISHIGVFLLLFGALEEEERSFFLELVFTTHFILPLP